MTRHCPQWCRAHIDSFYGYGHDPDRHVSAPTFLELPDGSAVVVVTLEATGDATPYLKVDNDLMAGGEVPILCAAADGMRPTDFGQSVAVFASRIGALLEAAGSSARPPSRPKTTV